MKPKPGQAQYHHRPCRVSEGDGDGGGNAARTFAKIHPDVEHVRKRTAEREPVVIAAIEPDREQRIVTEQRAVGDSEQKSVTVNWH